MGNMVYRLQGPAFLRLFLAVYKCNPLTPRAMVTMGFGESVSRRGERVYIGESESPSAKSDVGCYGKHRSKPLFLLQWSLSVAALFVM
jgi:hypothetical protein